MLLKRTAVAVAIVLSAIRPSIGQTLSLPARANAALPSARAAFDEALADYPSARFRNVHARLVHSVYADDEGHSNKVPWTHRGGVVLVICGEVNAKNHFGGYTGWTAFSFEPTQTDIVTMYDFGTPRVPRPMNLADRPRLMASAEGYESQQITLLCGAEAEQIDPTDLTAKISFSPPTG